MRLRLHLLNLQHGPRRMYCTITRKFMDTSTFTNRLNSSQPQITEKKLFDRFDTKAYQEIQLFVHSVQQATMRVKKT